MALFDRKKYNISKLDEKEQQSLYNLLEKLKNLINSRAMLYQPEHKRVIIRNDCYGTSDPSSIKNPIEGQIYFHIQS